jgi:sugar lactone lactonase YvrE
VGSAPHPTTPSTSTVSSGPAVPTFETDTGHTDVPADYACDDLPDTVDFQVIEIRTEEDFDFDAAGNLVYVNYGNMVAVSHDGNFSVLATGVADVAGIQVLDADTIIFATPYEASIQQVDIPTHSHSLVAGGLGSPDGLEIDDQGRIFYSERDNPGRESWIDPVTGEQGLVRDGLNKPNGLAFSPDDGTLYIASGFGAGEQGIIATDLAADGTWSAPRSVLSSDRFDFDGVEVDACGNIYGIGYGSTQLYRVKPDGTDPRIIADFGGGSLFNSMRWGSGIGGWPRDVLYVTDRRQLYAVSAGVVGRRSPVTDLDSETTGRARRP